MYFFYYVSKKYESFVYLDFFSFTNLWITHSINKNMSQIIYRYYDEVCALESKIPVHEFQVPFKYKDAFDLGTIFGGRASLSKYNRFSSQY